MNKKEIEMQVLIAQKEGMIAENMQRESLGHSMAYSSEHFNEIAQSMLNLIEIPWYVKAIEWIKGER